MPSSEPTSSNIRKCLDEAESRRLAEIEIYEDVKHIDNLETLVVRMARHIKRVSDGDSKIADQAMGYLERQARGSLSILRKCP